MRRSSLLPLSLMVVLVIAPPPASAQETIERTPNLSTGWVGYTGFVFLNAPFRFDFDTDGEGRVAGVPTFEASFGLPWHALAGARFAYGSPTVAGAPDEWELFGRIRPLSQAHDGPFDLGVSAGFNGAAESLDGEVSIARWLGPVKVIGVTRGMTSAFGTGDARLSVGGGAVLHPLRGSFPLAVTGDVTTFVDRHEGERIAWSAGLALGLTYSTHTLAVFATNTPTSTLQGASLGDNRVRFGFELTIPLALGRLLGIYVPRQEALDAVVVDPEEVGALVTADASNYLFFPKRLEIDAGTTVEWVNRDEAMHTVEADDGSWGSPAIQQGERWRARFDRPGLYAYHCGPHPFMRGIIYVR